jgi:hypothetical protein
MVFITPFCSLAGFPVVEIKNKVNGSVQRNGVGVLNEPWTPPERFRG